MKTTDTELSKAVKRTANTPQKDSDLCTLALNVVAKWKATPAIVLAWTDVNTHEASVKAFNSILNERLGVGGGRREITARLAALDSRIDEGIAAIKGYLVYKYEKENAPAYYPQFGIEKRGRVYAIPHDRDKRAAALPLILAAITAHGFTGEKYGNEYWQQTINDYTALLREASGIDGSVSTKVGAKNELRKSILKTHNALIMMIRANYPGTYKNSSASGGSRKRNIKSLVGTQPGCTGRVALRLYLVFV